VDRGTQGPHLIELKLGELAPDAAHPADTAQAFVAPEGDPAQPAPLGTRVVSILTIGLPLVGLIAAIAYLWGTAFSWVHLALLVVGYLLTALGITVGYHRLFTHKSFSTNVVMKVALGVLGSMAVQGPILQWVAVHRRHHQHSDREHDPHSPNVHGAGLISFVRGFVHAHCGWFFKAEPGGLDRYVPDLKADKAVRWTSKLFLVWVVMGLALPALIAGLVTGTWMGALLGLCWGGLARVFLVHHVTWSVNSVCHLWGTRPYASHDHSRNNALFGILALGEGWHNNHHAFPASARHGLAWWQLDVSYLVIRAMGLVGLASDIRVPAPERLALKGRR
jgi:stearoyl-CoA desaturase (delta-9 desaturase)